MKERQEKLPFAEAEGHAAERRNTVAAALARVAADLHATKLVFWIHDTEERTRTPLVKTYDQLAERPYGLCCSAAKARSTVRRAKALGLIISDEQRYVTGGQKGNAYTINQEGVSCILTGRSAGPGVTTDQGGVLCGHGAVTSGHPYKEHMISSVSSKPVPVPEGPARTQGPLQWSLLEDRRLQVPELLQAANRVVPPRSANSLAYGVFSGLCDKHLKSRVSLIEWFQRQLSAPMPVLAGTEAELLITLAVATYASEFPVSQLRSNRVALFVNTLTKPTLWARTLRYVPAAADELPKLRAWEVATAC